MQPDVFTDIDVIQHHEYHQYVDAMAQCIRCLPHTHQVVSLNPTIMAWMSRADPLSPLPHPIQVQWVIGYVA